MRVLRFQAVFSLAFNGATFDETSVNLEWCVGRQSIH